MMQRTLKELEEHRQAREEAERRCRQDQQRIVELQGLHVQLEELLEVERQAKRDEELVRKLQSTVLQEEFEKREQLEELKLSLEQLLHHEQERSSELEERRREQEKMLAEEQQRLEKLEQERQMRDQQYEVAVARLSEAERAKEQMEDELRRKEHELQKRSAAARFRAPPDRDDAVRMNVSHRGPGAFPRSEMTPWRRGKADETPSRPVEQVPAVDEDAVAAAGSTAPAALDAGADAVCPPCPPDDTSPDVAGAEAQTTASDIERSDDQPRDDGHDDEAQHPPPPQTASPPPLAAGNGDHLVTAST